MENLKRLLVLAAMFLPMSAWAAPSGPKYLNLYYKNSQLFVGLDKKDCVAGSSSEDEDKRIITITPHGKKYEDLCEAILWDIYI